jgi:hypothetical protein
MATNTLIIKDGNGSLTGLSTFSGSKGLIPEHAITGAVNVSASAANPVYVTGNVSISQPVNVDIVVGDNVFVTSSIASPVYISASTSSPLPISLYDINSGYTTGAGTGKSALLVYLTGAAGNKVEIKDLTLDNGKVPVTSSYANPIYAVGLMQITTSVNSPALVQINNDNADEAFNAISSSFGGNELRVVLSGSGNTVKMGGYEVVWVRTTGSAVTVDNEGFQQLVNYLTAAVDLTDSSYKLKVVTTGSSAVSINNQSADAAFNALSQSFVGNQFRVQLSGSTNTIRVGNYDAVVVRTTGSEVTVTNTITASINNFPAVQSVSLSGISTILDPVTNSTGSAVSLIGDDNYVTLVQSTASVTSSKGNPLFVISDSDKPVYVANQSANGLYITSSNSFPLQVQIKPPTYASKQKYVANQFGFDWAINSGTFVLATQDSGRKSLIISNPSPHELYISVGSGALNGFQIDSLTIPPETYSFIVYPSGTYTADEYAASVFHAGFFVSQSDNSSLKALATRIGY